MTLFTALFKLFNTTENPSVCLSVRQSVRHTPVLCQNEETQRDVVFTIW